MNVNTESFFFMTGYHAACSPFIGDIDDKKSSQSESSGGFLNKQSESRLVPGRFARELFHP